MTINAVFIGSVDFSRSLLETILRIEKITISGIVSKSSTKYNSDFESLIPIAKSSNIPFLDYKNNDELCDWLSNLNVDLIFCFGWSHLLPEEVLEIPQYGVWGYHPAKIPHNRGRHPIIWALTLGLSETASTFFKIDKNTDSGDIISQEIVRIDYQDTAMDLYEKLKNLANKQLQDSLMQLLNEDIKYTPQDNKIANHWRKRIKKDGEIDWRMSSLSIYNLVRALTKPYPGATFSFGDLEVIVWKVEEIESGKQNDEPGKVIGFVQNDPIVKCGDQSIRLIDYEPRLKFSKGEYIL